MEKTTTTLLSDIIDYNADQLDKKINANGVQAITGVLLNGVLKNLTARLKDVVDSTYNKRTDDTDDLNSGERNRFVYVVESLTDRNNLADDLNTSDSAIDLVTGDICIVTDNGGNISSYSWDGSSWVHIYTIIGTELDIKVLDTPQSNQSAVNKQWVQYNSGMLERVVTQGTRTSRININSSANLIEILSVNTANTGNTSIRITPELITLDAFEGVFIDNLPVYDNELDADNAGLDTNQIYQTSTGELRIKL